MATSDQAPEPLRLTVQYERKFSDGNYGSEGVSMGMTFTRDPEAFDPDEMLKAASALRGAVLEQLSKSESWRVAQDAARELYPPTRAPAPQQVAAYADEQPPPPSGDEENPF